MLNTMSRIGVACCGERRARTARAHHPNGSSRRRQRLTSKRPAAQADRVRWALWPEHGYSSRWDEVEEAGRAYRGCMNAARSSRRRRASIIIHRRKPGAGRLRTRKARRRYSVSRRRRESAWADAMLNLRTFGWLSRRLGRLWINECGWRSAAGLATPGASCPCAPQHWPLSARHNPTSRCGSR
jgi:hypothetical protein